MKRRRPAASSRIGGQRSGLPWFEPEEYPRILEVMNYPPDMSRDYERWREVAENKESALKRMGKLVVRVVVHPEEFISWCATHSIQPNSGSIDGFVEYHVIGDLWPNRKPT